MIVTTWVDLTPFHFLPRKIVNLHAFSYEKLWDLIITSTVIVVLSAPLNLRETLLHLQCRRKFYFWSTGRNIWMIHMSFPCDNTPSFSTTSPNNSFFAGSDEQPCSLPPPLHSLNTTSDLSVLSLLEGEEGCGDAFLFLLHLSYNPTSTLSQGSICICCRKRRGAETFEGVLREQRDRRARMKLQLGRSRGRRVEEAGKKRREKVASKAGATTIWPLD